MKLKSKREDKKKPHQYPLPGEIGPREKQQNRSAQTEANADMSHDAELTSHNQNDDLDEGESARLGEQSTDLV